MLLQRLGEIISETNLVRRFVDAIKRQTGRSYNDVITVYEGQMIKGDPYTVNQLRKFLALKYVQAGESKTITSEMPGFANIESCTNYGRVCHTKIKCWRKHPEREPKGPSKRNERHPKNIEC